MRLVRAKIAVPATARDTVVRSRVVDEIRHQLAIGSHLRIYATAGSGKTTAVITALTDSRIPVAWLTLDRLDTSPGRLLIYIEAALQRALGKDLDVVSDAVRRGASLLDTAAFLAEALDDRDFVYVVDDTEKIADSPDATEVLDTFVLNMPPSARSILIGREDMGGHFLDPLRGMTLRIGDRTLAFTAEEAEQVLSDRGFTDVDADQAVQATGGWITGILFELWRYSEHRHGDGGETDPLNGYLSKEIMDRLSQAQQLTLVATSVLDEVNPASAEALGIAQAGEILYSLSRLHLPVEFDRTGTTMRCHARFREYLQAQLQRSDPRWVRSVRRAHGQLLVAERRPEDAVAEFLAGNDLEGAARVAAGVIQAVLDRLDFGLAEQWLDAIGTAEVRKWPALVAAAAQVACEAERYAQGAAYADRLLDEDFCDRSFLTPPLITTIAWCFFLVSRIEDAKRLLDSSPDAPEIRLMRFCIGLELLNDPTHYRDRPPDCDGPADGLLARADLAHGRFLQVLNSQSRPWAAIALGRVGALRALGRTAEAMQLMESLPAGSWTAVRTRAELLVDASQDETAYTVLLQGREHLARSGSNLYRMFELLLEAALALRFRGDTLFARAALNEVEREPTALLRARIVEQLRMWRGLAALLEGDNQEAATELRAAVHVMTEWDRLLYLPTGAVYLAEAEWRLDNPEEADAAADLALEAAERQGSHHLLIQALKEFPAVISRRLDAESGPDSAWHGLGRAILAPEIVSAHQLRAPVTVLDVGQQSIDVDGTVVVPKLVKSVEFLSYLASEGGRAPKAALIANLFENSPAESAAAYFRMALNGLRKVLPPDAPLGIDGQDVVWTDGVLTSSALAIESIAAGIPQLPLSQQLAAVSEVLSRMAAREFLPQSRSEWVVARRERLERLRTDVLEMGATAAYRTGEYRKAAAFAEQVLQRDELREQSWRLLMRVASALGDTDRVTSAYLRCVDALRGIGAAPEPGTAALARQLRGEPVRPVR